MSYARLPTSDATQSSAHAPPRLSTSSDISDDVPLSASPAQAQGGTGVELQSPTQAGPGPVRNPPRFAPEDRLHDGVFANLMAVPGPEEKLPSYFEAVGRPPTTHLSTTVVRPGNYANPFLERYQVSDDGEFLVEGIAVGNWALFGVNLLVSVVFDFIGFMLTFFLATSHAAREGSRAGLGVTLVRYGLVVLHKARQAQAGGGMADDDPDGDMDGIDGQGGEWIAYPLMVVGWILVLKSFFTYIRCRRIQAIALYAAESSARPGDAERGDAAPAESTTVQA
ncbi:hypothetical protein M427DRAFT_51426 [Gonapodya prolifera JEL478]|uniref:Uncharacterized protein n=1 Tax=Gonapodya prolifera (strain JEL478) TaxID=1344416 RepID=A0A139AWS8_GONPJ|nr:hypothetical protein M427DRAFT_51426 [Gonapodya prolifera JEL478]|eukprot:KXS21159.1 hypothetical protein M427DRAFT_51426 [Gonapodya prolifera JEL478]